MKLLLLFCFSYCLSIVCLAQNKIAWGSHLSVGQSNLLPPDSKEKRSQSLTTYRAGIYSKIPLNTRFSLRPQLSWHQKGFQYITVGENLKEHFHYISPSISFSYCVLPHKIIRPFVQAGLQGNVLLAGKAQIQTITGIRKSNKFDLSAFHRFTYGGLLAVGAECHRFTLSIEANHDFRSFLNSPDFFKDVTPKVGWYGANISYRIF